MVKRLVLRVPKEDALLPHQLLNEVAFRGFVTKNLPSILVPKVHAYNLTPPWIVEDFIEGTLLSTLWPRYSEHEKEAVCRKFAKMVAMLGETTFGGIGGLVPSNKNGRQGTELGPTVEGCKLFKGRGKLHAPEFYNIGPYKSAKEYVLAYYDKEIAYYSHPVTAGDIDMDLFEKVQVADFVETLRRNRGNLQRGTDHLSADNNTEEEPFVAVHGDFHGRNILMNGTEVNAVLDWEFAGAYPLSELFDGIDVVEMDSEEMEEENDKWNARLRMILKEVVEERGWGEREKRLLFSDGNPVLQTVRIEMFPY